MEYVFVGKVIFYVENKFEFVGWFVVGFESFEFSIVCVDKVFCDFFFVDKCRVNFNVGFFRYYFYILFVSYGVFEFFLVFVWYVEVLFGIG